MKNLIVKTLTVAALAATIAMTACTGVPLRSIPRLVQLQNELLEANPTEFMVALQVDDRLVPPPGAAPLLVIKLVPKDPAAYEAIDKKLPLQLTVASIGTLGLEPPAPGRCWLIYSMPPATQAELLRIQATVRQAKANPQYKTGGTLGVGIEQDALANAVTDPVLAETRWNTWLQVKQRDGFFEVWSGTPAQLRNAAKADR